jgi:hypothetical protein
MNLATAACWQTPTAQDANGRDRHNQRDGSVRLSLLGQARAEAAKVRRVPTAKGDQGRWETSEEYWSRQPPADPTAVTMWATPTVQDSENNGGPSQFERNTHALNVQAIGSPLAQAKSPDGMVLNPPFVESLMGFPAGWTALDAWEMPLSRLKRR